MPSDPSTLIALGIGAAILLWLVFSVMKKLFGLAIIAAIAFGAYMVWTNPELLRQAMAMVGMR
ncbi:hypothetical protein SAMN06295905_1649 [Devosia lucknowensis]|uniref:Uncharacterized protein n=1 Tax=Devosia lucknowensis TaxID=1096929 RepID=A0A1Y6F2D3_9HYPH|nr:hypothetical protein [Devosia lucknowensis]SMQ68749.1 hypothetical protein SAMN06295905_1649 [Devosia lucknowensis]